MNHRKEIINILTKCASSSPLSVEEAKILAEWKANSQGNEQLHNELTNEKIKSAELKLFSEIDVDSDWEELRERLAPKTSLQSTLWRRLLPYAAMLCTGLFLYLAHYYLTRTEIPSVAQIKETHDVQTATQGATLILADGQTIKLDKKTKINNSQGVTLNATASELQIATLPHKDTDPSASNVIIVPKGAYYTVVLADHTKVWLNANSKLTFPSSFTTDERRIKIEGEAFFDVSHDEKKPFIVEAQHTQIRVLGTKFNVNAYTDHIRTSLQQGKVQLASNYQKAILAPGQYGEWDGLKFKIAPANLTKDLAWKNNEFRFENDDIIHIAYELSRWYDVKVKFIGNIDMKKQYSGSMSRDLSLAKVLNVLQFGSDFEFKIQDRELLIMSK